MPHSTMNITPKNFIWVSLYDDVCLQDINPAYRDAAPNVFETTPYFGDCDCDEHVRGYIHPAYIAECPYCGAIRDESPNSRVNEVFIQLTCNPSTWC